MRFQEAIHVSFKGNHIRGSVRFCFWMCLLDQKSEIPYCFAVFLFVSVKYEELYCFSFNPKLDKEEREKGWKLVDLNEEYNRMGIPNSYWQISDVNRDYGVSYFFNVMGPLEWISSLAVSFLVLRCKTLVYSVLYTCVVWYSSSPFPTLKCIQIAGKRMHLHLMCNLSTVSFKC